MPGYGEMIRKVKDKVKEMEKQKEKEKHIKDKSARLIDAKRSTYNYYTDRIERAKKE